MIRLKPRLQLIADFVRKGVPFADVGTDHAYIPAWLLINKISPFGLASDIKKGPLENAYKNLSKYNLTDKVTLIQTDGIPKEAYDIYPLDIIIAGMGGEMICSIIENAGIDIHHHRLILQPMTDAPMVRRYLYDKGFNITDEKLTREGDKLYSAMTAVYMGESISYTDIDIFVGKNLVEHGGEVFDLYLKKNINRLNIILDGYKKSSLNDREFVSKIKYQLKIFEDIRSDLNG